MIPFSWVLLGFTGFYLVSKGSSWVLLGFTAFDQVSSGFSGFSLVLEAAIGVFTGFYWVLPGFNEATRCRASVKDGERAFPMLAGFKQVLPTRGNRFISR